MAIVADSVAILAQPVWAQGARIEPVGGQPPVGSVASVTSLDEQATDQRAFEVDGIGCAPANSPSWFAAARPAAVR